MTKPGAEIPSRKTSGFTDEKARRDARQAYQPPAAHHTPAAVETILQWASNEHTQPWPSKTAVPVPPASLLSCPCSRVSAQSSTSITIAESASLRHLEISLLLRKRCRLLCPCHKDIIIEKKRLKPNPAFSHSNGKSLSHEAAKSNNTQRSPEQHLPLHQQNN